MKTGVTSNLKDLIKDIGRAKDELKAPNNPLDEYMINVGIQIVSQLKQSLNDEGLGSSILSQSLSSSVVSSNDITEVTITASDYWKFINDGVNGVQKNVGGKYSFKTKYPNKKMANSIQTWMSLRGIGSSKDFKTISYAIATKVKRDGIEPTHFVDKVLTEQFIKDLEERLSEEFKKSLSLKII